MTDQPKPPVEVTLEPGGLMQLKCSKCTEDFYVRMPVLEIINRPICTLLVIPHPETQFCPNCGQGYQYFLQSIGEIKSIFTVVNDTATPKIVLAPPGMKVPPAKM